MASWDSIPEPAPVPARLMEVFAGFVEHVDAQVGRLFDALDAMRIRDNTIIFYVFGDNGSSAEGQNGTISELLAQNLIPNTIEQQLEALNRIGGLDALGGPQVRQHVPGRLGLGGRHAVPPYQARSPRISAERAIRWSISWPEGIKPDKTPRPQFHHVNDIVPTIYDILGSRRPRSSTGWKQYCRSTASA